jgi:hypothetical protein
VVWWMCWNGDKFRYHVSRPISRMSNFLVCLRGIHLHIINTIGMFSTSKNAKCIEIDMCVCRSVATALSGLCSRARFRYASVCMADV